MGERWDRDRFMNERSSRESLDRPDDDRYIMRGGRGDGGRRVNRSFDDDDLVQDRRHHDDEPRFIPRRERDRSPPEFSRRIVLEKERERDIRRESPPRRPQFLRRQSSLDTFDRPPHPIFHHREEYPPPARREDIRRDDYRAPAYVPIPLPKSRRLPPPRSRFPDRGFYEEIGVAEPDFYGDDDYRPYPERVREREVVRRSSRTRRHRDRSRDSLSTRSRSRSSSRSSSSSGGTTVRSEYPKKGKTRIPAKLVDIRAIIEIGYPFVKEGNVIIIQKALGQENIDFLLERSEEIRKEDAERAARAALPAPPPKPAPEPKAKPPPPTVVAPPPQPAPETKAPAAPMPIPVAKLPPPATVPAPAPAPPTTAPAPPVPQGAPIMTRPAPPPDVRVPPPPMAPPVHMKPAPPPVPIIIDATPPPPREPPLEIVDETIIRDYSPSRSSTTTSTSWDSHHHNHRRRHRREKSAPVAIGPLALVERSRSRSRHGRSRSRSGRELRAEIRALERELAHRPKGAISEREIVRAERLPDGQLVVYEEEVEDVVTHHKPPRIEKDKKGRMSISVPKYR